MVTSAANPVHSLAFGYDSRGFPASMADPYGTTTYSHDDRGRLLGADHPATSPVPDETYTYDGAYRRTSWAVNPLSEVLYNAGDQLVQDAQFFFEYDDEGRRTAIIDRGTAEVTAYAWDALGQLVRLQTVGGDWRFDYDALGRRTLVEGPGGFVRTFAYDTNDLARVVYDGSGAVVASYVTGMGFGEVLAEDRGGVVRYAVRDKLGTPVAWLDGLGGVAELVPRDAYGRRVGGSPADVVPYGYTGHAEDPTGLVWGRARYLDTRTGTWLSEDPVYTEPRYGYVWGSPRAAIDPTGKVVAIITAAAAVQSSCNAIGVAGSAAVYASGGFGYVAGILAGVELIIDQGVPIGLLNVSVGTVMLFSTYRLAVAGVGAAWLTCNRTGDMRVLLAAAVAAETTAYGVAYQLGASAFRVGQRF